MKASIVLGLQFGDEGKGLTTSYLVSKATKPLVIRFNGGHQAGHTVVHNNQRHIFSSFGSGTLQNCPTYWSKYCTFSPTPFKREHLALKEYKPVIFVSDLSPISTPFDRLHNFKLEKEKQHGSCGMGFGATIQRQEDHYTLYYQDLFFDSILKMKLKNIIEYYKDVLPENYKDIIRKFYEDIEYARMHTIPDFKIKNFHYYTDLIFEGAQGILLDMDFGFFPNVTRSNTTSKNAFDIINNGFFGGVTNTDIYYITRCYQTRHGNGPMTNEDFGQIDLINNENETNVKHEWQGEFRKSMLDIDLINYAIKCDSNFSDEDDSVAKHLVVTCLDQFKTDQIPYTFKDNLFTGDIEEIKKKINLDPNEFKGRYRTKYLMDLYSYGPSLNDMTMTPKQLEYID